MDEKIPPSGFILVHKPPGPTSHNIVQTVKRCLKAQSVGHLGTLDPFASGVLPVLVGGTARLAEYAMPGLKGYRFAICFGKQTDTLDLVGAVIKEAPVSDRLPFLLASCLHQFIGDIVQVPPEYSALKYKGMTLYEYMRAFGELPMDIQEKKRIVYIDKLELLRVEYHAGQWLAWFDVVCGKGTYVRSLARDIAIACGTVGHCLALERWMVHPWKLEDCVPFPKDWKDADPLLIQSSLRPATQFLPSLEVIEVPSENIKSFQAGNPFRMSDSLTNVKDGFAFVKAAGVMFLATISATECAQVIVSPKKKISG